MVKALKLFIPLEWRKKLKKSAKHGFLAGLKHRLLAGHVVRSIRITGYLQVTEKPCLQIGGGRHLIQGWLNGDLVAGDIYLNASKPFPMPNDSFSLVFAEHFIEHLSFNDGEKCLGEIFRVLKPGGVLRLSTPDLNKLCLIYQGNNSSLNCEDVLGRHKQNHNPGAIFCAHFINDIFRLWGHSFIYDEYTLGKCLEKVGFIEIKRNRFGVSMVDGLKNLERHADVECMKDGFTLILEAKK